MITEKNMMHGVDYLDDDVSGWLMSEKIHGCRAFWDGSTKWSRGGKMIAIPDVMRKSLPDGIPLDGEINAGRDGFEIVRRFVQYGSWNKHIKFSAFDAPSFAGCFDARYIYLTELLSKDGIVNYIPHQECREINDAYLFMADVQLHGGEGIVLRYRDNRYSPGRTDQVLKLKRRVYDNDPDGYKAGRIALLGYWQKITKSLSRYS
jgi:DNA ligase-1